MSKIALLVLAFMVLFSVSAQVQVRNFPKAGYDQRIRDFVYSMKIVDTHEHLVNPAIIKKSWPLDFMLLLNHYAIDDIKSGGLLTVTFDGLMKDSLEVQDKWKRIAPYWLNASNTAYNRSVLLTVQKLFGVDDLKDSTVEVLSEKIRHSYDNETKWFNYVLKSKCKIQFVVLDRGDQTYGDPEMFRYVKRFDNFVNIDSWSEIKSLMKASGIDIKTVDDLIIALNIAFDKALKEGIVAVKTALAYNRTLLYEEVEKGKAEAVFNQLKMLGDKATLPFSEAKYLQDYMMHRLLELAEKSYMPVQVHTGLQAGQGNAIENANPTLLSNLFLKYPNVKFILFHGAYPYGGELSVLAKNFRNVYIDLCWLYIISPSYSERYLNEWLETTPANKIMAFGGDFKNVEGVYGHQLLARQVVVNVLTTKVKDGYFSEEEAISLARKILHDNAIAILNLN
jgi:hypothetical protein